MVGDGMKALHKDFWMEIRKSKARFISIFLIVALGPATYAQIAQLVEQRTENPRVAGSIPALGMF